MPPDPITFSSAETAPLRPIYESYWVVPGKLLAGEYPAVTFTPDVTRRRLSAFLDAEFDTFINLTCAGEAEDYKQTLVELAQARGQVVECLNFPIGDFGLPSVAEMCATLDAIDAALASGQKVYLHCYGGIGRTGTTVGCYLVRHGLTGKQSLLQLAAWWSGVPKSMRFPNSPETYQQEQFVLGWQELKK